MLYVAAAMLNFLDRRSGSVLATALLDEDSITIANVFLLVFCAKFYSGCLLACLMIWAILNVAELGFNQLRGVQSLKMFKPAIVHLRLHRVRYIQLKNNIEVFVAFSSPFAWLFFAMNAPLLPILFV